MGLLSRVLDVVERAAWGFGDEPEPPGSPRDPRSPEERAYVEQFTDESEVDRLRRQNAEYFEIIERIELERDGLWRMHRQGVAEHLNAQALLEQQLMTARLQLSRTVTMLNKVREEAGVELIKKPEDLEEYTSEPVGTARRYAESMTALCQEFPALLAQVRPRMLNGKWARALVERSEAVADGDKNDPRPDAHASPD